MLAASRSEYTYLAKDLISAGAQPWSSPFNSNRTSTVEGRAHTHDFDVRSIELDKTENSRLTAEAHKELQQSISSQLDEWVRTPERHEQLAIGWKTMQSRNDTIGFLRRHEPGIEKHRFDARHVGSALRPTIMSHYRYRIYASPPVP